jgi:hypothetical protein
MGGHYVTYCLLVLKKRVPDTGAIKLWSLSQACGKAERSEVALTLVNTKAFRTP